MMRRFALRLDVRSLRLYLLRRLAFFAMSPPVPRSEVLEHPTANVVGHRYSPNNDAQAEYAPDKGNGLHCLAPFHVAMKSRLPFIERENTNSG